jgi:ribonuclease HI
MYFDGSLKLGRASAGVLYISPDGKQLKYVLQILWQATNNEAEYEALIHETLGSYLSWNKATTCLR